MVKGKKGISPIVTIILILVVVGIVLLIAVPRTRTLFKSLVDIKKSYEPPKLALNNNFLFRAEGIQVDKYGPGCTDSGDAMECGKDSSVSFNIDVSNDGDKMRNFKPAIIMCEDDVDDCCGTGTIVGKNSEECTVAPGETLACTTVDYKFKVPGEYKIYPVVECIADPDVGCYDPESMQTGVNMATSSGSAATTVTTIKSCNNDRYVKMIVT